MNIKQILILRGSLSDREFAKNLSRKRRAVFKFLQKLLSNHNVHLQICQSFLWMFAKIVISQVYEFVVLIEKCV